MKNSASLVQKANIVPSLKLAVQKEGGGIEGTGSHTVKLLGDKIIKEKEYRTGKEVYAVEYLVEEDGIKKTYSVPIKDKDGELHYLVQRLSEFPEGSMVVMEYQRKGMRGFILVKPVGQEEKVINSDDIPIIEDPPPSPIPSQQKHEEQPNISPENEEINVSEIFPNPEQK